MDNTSWKGIPYTFLLGALAMVLTFWGCYLSLFNPDVFVDVMWSALGAYGLTSTARKVSGAVAARKGSVPAETQTNNGG